MQLFRQNFVLVSYFDKLGYLCLFENNKFKFSFNSNLVRIDFLLTNENSYMFDRVDTYVESLNMELCGTKCKIMI